jgi:beta-lactamase regulating signal transducer with metallopeptidase domain
MSIPLEASWAWLFLQVSVKGSVLLLAALVACRALRHSSAAVRHLIWAAALAGMLLIPAVAAVVPAWHVAVAPPAALIPAFDAVSALEAPLPGRVTTIPAMGPLPASPTGTAPVAFGTYDVPAVTSTSPLAAYGFEWRSWLPWLWAFGATLILLRLLAGVLGVWWLERRATVVTDTAWLGLAHRLAQRLGLSRAVTLLRGDGAAVPMTWGVLQPVVWLPAEAEVWTSERREVVLAHELAHIHRRDVITQWIGHVALALHWFNPLVWFAVRHLREERERACDDAVLALGMQPTRYAQHLLDIVRTLGTSSGPASALAMARRSQFEGRLLAVLDRRARRAGPGRIQTALVASVLFCGVLPLAAISPVTVAANSSLAEDAVPEDLAVAASLLTAEMENNLEITPPALETLPLPSYGLGPGDSNYLHWSNAQGMHAEIRARGKVEFSQDGVEIRRITPGGFLRVETRGQGSHRRIEVRPGANGELRYSYFVDGAQREWHEHARAWLASVTTYLARSSTDELRLLEDEVQLRALEQTTSTRTAAPPSPAAPPAPARTSAVQADPSAPPAPPAFKPASSASRAQPRHGVWNTRYHLTGTHHGQPSFQLNVQAENVVRTPDRQGVAEILPGGLLLVEEERFAGDPETPAPTARPLGATPAGSVLQCDHA